MVTSYPILKVAFLHIYYITSYIYTDRGGGRCHCETIYAYFDITFAGIGRVKFINLNIQCNIFIPTIMKMRDWLRSPRSSLQLHTYVKLK